MNWKQHLFKPKWQHKEPEIRREAVAHQNEPGLMAALPDILLSDEDAGVRSIAARRITDLELLARAVSTEKDPVALEAINARITGLCTSVADNRPELESRMAIVSATDKRDLLELVASHAPESSLRKLALSKVTRQGFLGDRAVNDTDPDLRSLAASRINQHSTLRRVIESSRKSDKSLHQALVARLHQELLDELDPVAVREEALRLCVALEAYALKHSESSEKVPDEMGQTWTKIESAAPEDLKERYQLIAERLSLAVVPAQSDTPQEDTPAEPETELAPGAAIVAIDPVKEEIATSSKARTESLEALVRKLDQFALKAGDSPSPNPLQKLKEQWDRTWADISESRPKDNALRDHGDTVLNKLLALTDGFQEQQEQSLNQAETLLEKLSRQLEEGALHKSLETRHRLDELGKSLAGTARWKSIRKQMGTMHGRIKELRDWQHWSNDKVRKQLIREMEILPDTDLHPDAILDRVKSLQSRWKELEVSEQIPGDSHYHAAPWMWRKFSAAGHKAFGATKPYLQKRDEIRDKHLAKQKDLCEQVKAAAGDKQDTGQLSKLLQSVRKEMRDLDLLPHKVRKRAASRLRKALDLGNEVMQSHYAEIEKQKLKLVRAASQLSYLEDNDAAIQEAKQLQAQWKQVGRLWRSRENELWQAFREPLDPLFGKLKEAQESDRAEIRERLEAQETLCKNLTEVLDGSDEDLLESIGKVQGLKDAWRDIEHPNQRLQKQFQDMAKRFDQRLTQHRLAQVQQNRKDRWTRSALIHKLETLQLSGSITKKDLDNAKRRWPGNSVEEIDQLLEQRYEKICVGESEVKVDKQSGEKASQLCIQLEFLAGLASPKSEKDERMKYQVERLSRSLSGEGVQLSAVEEARKAEQEWLTLPLLPEKKYLGFERRIKAALEEIDRTNSE